MKIYLARFVWEPSGADTTVILADNLEEAKQFIIDDENPSMVFVDTDPNTENECQISEHSLGEKGLLYTGYFCC